MWKISLFPGKERIPDEVDILVIADVRSKIPEGDFRMICEYIERGGNLFLLGEPGTQEFIIRWQN